MESDICLSFCLFVSPHPQLVRASRQVKKDLSSFSKFGEVKRKRRGGKVAKVTEDLQNTEEGKSIVRCKSDCLLGLLLPLREFGFRIGSTGSLLSFPLPLGLSLFLG